MTLSKVTADFADRSLAMATASALQDFIEPAPDALSVFENGPGKWRLEAYFEDAESSRGLASRLEPLVGATLPAFTDEDVPDLNWVAMSQAALPPVVAGRFTIHGSHDRHRVARGPNAIVIDAGEAFGTAHHATTYGCLLALDKLTRAEAFEHVLDLGTGSGVLSIAVARALPDADIIATDLDAQSVKVAAENMRLNGVGGRVAVACANGLGHPWLRLSPPFDLVIANILAGPLIHLANDIGRKVARSGTLLLSGLLIDQAPQVIAAYRSAGFQVVDHNRVVGWSTLVLRRR